MTECDLDKLVKEHVSDLMAYGEVDYAKTLDRLYIDFVINRVTEDVEAETFKEWVKMACKYGCMTLAASMREAVAKKAYEIIWENLSALNNVFEIQNKRFM